MFLAPAGGGIVIKLQDKEYQMITPQTPLGQSLIGLTLDDTLSLNNGLKYEVVAIR